MKEFKGTSGPWKVNEVDDDDISEVSSTMVVAGPHVIACIGPTGNTDLKSDIDNANLIAAAPDLLEALQTIQAKMSGFIKLANEVGINDADGFYLAAATDVENQARAAISKALGQE